jgi:metal-responsive CopG/Arc/MetJ family transcriptional regulator
MKIISISLGDKNIDALQTIKNAMGHANNSEAIRAAINIALEKINKENSIKGIANATISTIHPRKTEKFISETKHKFNKIIIGQNHSCINENKCIDNFILHGKSEEIINMRNTLIKNKDINKVIFSWV